MFKHNSLNLFWVSDVGFLGNDLQKGTSTADYLPFATNSQNFPVARQYGYAGNGHVAGGMNIYNLFVCASVMTWAVERTKFHGISTP